MPLETGTRLGPYEILAPVGAGGMGEVYRARDSRLGRDVAVKVLPPAFARDRERLQRFEHEARAAGALNHPGITAIYDVGTDHGIPFLVSELLDGESLRAVIAAGPLPPARVADLGAQAAQALAAAHAKGIVHRDLKPENLQALPDGRLKVLDFGLAKLAATDAPPRDETGPQLESLTRTGTILGTASYMAPEQVRDQKVDHRADLFALGAILYELASGTKAFPGETPADRMTAILARDPAPLPPAVEAALPGLEAVIRRCLEKRAEDRFDSARDLAFTLRLLVAAADSARSAGPRREAAPARSAVPDVRFRQITFREGLVSGARFASDGQTVVYGASWGGQRRELYLTRVGIPEPRSLGIAEGYLLAVSQSDELLVRLRSRDLGGFTQVGVLARLPLMGGVPRELSDDVFQAAFGPDGKKIAAVRLVGGTYRLEYPLGTVRFESEGWMSNILVLPDESVLFFDHPARGDNGGYPALLGPEGVRRLVETRFPTLGVLALVPGAREFIVSGQGPDGSAGAYFVSMDGKWRPALRTPTASFIEDVSRSGDVLLRSLVPRMRMETGTRGGSATRELAWFDWAVARDLTPDGATVLFDETGPSVARAMAFVRGTDGSPAVHIADGHAMRFSRDGRTAMIGFPEDPTAFDLVPLGIGESVRHTITPVHVMTADWLPDGRSLCLAGFEPGRRMRVYRYDLTTRSVEPLTEEGSGHGACFVSPDGRFVFTPGPKGHTIYPLAGGEPRILATLTPQHRGIGWSPDGGSVFAFERGCLPVPILRVDLESGRAETWMEIHPRSESGVLGANSVCLSSDGERYVTSYPQTLSDLYVGTGLLQP